MCSAPWADGIEESQQRALLLGELRFQKPLQGATRRSAVSCTAGRRNRRLLRRQPAWHSTAQMRRIGCLDCRRQAVQQLGRSNHRGASHALGRRCYCSLQHRLGRTQLPRASIFIHSFIRQGQRRWRHSKPGHGSQQQRVMPARLVRHACGAAHQAPQVHLDHVRIGQVDRFQSLALHALQKHRQLRRLQRRAALAWRGSLRVANAVEHMRLRARSQPVRALGTEAGCRRLLRTEAHNRAICVGVGGVVGG